MSRIIHIFIMAILAAFMIYTLAFSTPDSADTAAGEETRQFISDNGYNQTGAANLVTAIYLGYRAFDTLGETIVLIASVAGVVYLMGSKE